MQARLFAREVFHYIQHRWNGWKCLSGGLLNHLSCEHHKLNGSLRVWPASVFLQVGGVRTNSSASMSTADLKPFDTQVADLKKLKRGLPHQRRRGRVRQTVDSSIDDSQASSDTHLEEHQQRHTEFPSDVENIRSTVSFHDSQNPARYAFRPKIDPSETSLILFPGRGSQFVGMGAKLLDYPNVVDMFDVARRVLGYDLLEICLRGPKETLDKTVICQPAVLVTSLAAVEKLKVDNPWAVQHCISAAGYDVGEIAALAFTGAISFEDAVRLVKVRAESMQAASQLVPSGAITVFFNHDAKIQFACHAAKLYCLQKLGMSDAVCQITEYLYSGCKVIAGNQEALNFIQRNAKEFGIQRIQCLPVSGAFNSRLMHSAIAPMSRSLTSMQLSKPVVPVHSNVTSRQHRSSAGAIGRQLLEQVWKPIKWEQTMHIMYSRRVGEKFPSTFEVGPGRRLGAILQQINAKAYEEYTNVDV